MGEEGRTQPINVLVLARNPTGSDGCTYPALPPATALLSGLNDSVGMSARVRMRALPPYNPSLPPEYRRKENCKKLGN